MKKAYQFLEHTGDIKLKAWGQNPENLFQNITLGMLEILKPEIKKGEMKKRKIEVRAENLELLLVDFLNELLYQMDINQEAYQDFKFKIFDNKKIEAELSGKPLKSFGLEIKAATYNELKIQKKDNLWQGEIVFDI